MHESLSPAEHREHSRRNPSWRFQNARLFNEIEEKSRQLAEASQHKSG
jgi:hypothetical protein